MDGAEISPTFDYTKLIVQPQWSNGDLLNYLKDNLVTSDNDAGIFCFIKRYGNKSYLVFKTLRDLVSVHADYNLIVNPGPIEDYIEVYKYSINDNYKMFGLFGSKKQAYGYYDYANSEYVKSEISCQGMKSLSGYFLVDQNDSEDSDRIVDTGTSNDFTGDFMGRVKSSYFNRLSNLLSMWVLIPGDIRIVPGITMKVLFGTSAENIASHLYSGYWLVKRVVHNFGEKFSTRLLLIRNGIDTDARTTLLLADDKKRV